MTRTEPISYVEATIRALEEDNAELLTEIERLRAALENAAMMLREASRELCTCKSHSMVPCRGRSYEDAADEATAALTAQPAAPGGDA